MIDLLKIGGYIGIAVGGVTGLWTAADYVELRPVYKKELVQLQLRLDQTSDSVLRLTFENLRAKQQNGGLTFDEQQTLCQIATILHYVHIPGC